MTKWEVALRPRRDGLVVSVSASHAVGCGFASRSVHTKDHLKNGTNYFPTWHAGVRVGVKQCSPTILKAGLCVELSISTCP